MPTTDIIIEEDLEGTAYTEKMATNIRSKALFILTVIVAGKAATEFNVLDLINSKTYNFDKLYQAIRKYNELP
jgi:hypothetical protein